MQNKQMVMKNYIRIVTRIALVLALVLVSYKTFSILRWKMYVWLPDYLSQLISAKPSVDGLRHVLFVFVDHYEPGFGERGAENNREWLENYRKLADRHQDSYGRKPQHTWFYAYDHLNADVMTDLSHIVAEGYGEIEFHWHHKDDTNETFKHKLTEAIRWFNSFGALISENGKVSFGFIHGNWSLDNARGPHFCGVNRELDILKEAGCYADFTFPAFADESQPPLVNRLFYAHDDDKPKSYEHGRDSVVGKTNSEDLLIFEGPINLTRSSINRNV